MPRHRPRQAAIAAALLAAATAAAAHAQSREYTLDDTRAWNLADAPEPGSPEATLAEARAAIARDEPGRAKSILDEFIEPREETDNPLLAEAYLLRGDALVALDREYRALYDYESVIRRFPQSPQFRTANQRELDIGLAYAAGKRIKILGLRIGDSEDIAVEILIRVQERMPSSELAETAAIELADFYYRKRDMALARDAYDLYLLNFPEGPNRMKAAQRRIYAEVARFKGPRYDSAGLLNARIRIANFARRYPGEAERTGLNQGLIARIDESLANQNLDTAQWYLSRGDQPAARLALSRLIREHPESLAAERARQLMTDRGWPTPSATNPDQPQPDDDTP